MDIYEESLKMHEKVRGKIAISPKSKLENTHDLALAYTPGVAEVSRRIKEHPEEVYKYTIKHNSVAVVSDGSAVLGLGNIGAEAAIPVMEGKAVLFKELAGIDAFPICVKTQDADEIVNLVKNIAPVFGGINLEDISAPRCFDIEARLQDIGIPVMHDDQHGTAVVTLAGLINACKLAGKNIEELKIVVNGAGSAGIAITKLLLCIGADKNICRSVHELILCDRKGTIYDGRIDNMNKHKEAIAKYTNPKKISGPLSEAIKGADVFIGVSAPGALHEEDIKNMAEKPIIFAMANPVPEIMPGDAKNAGAFIVATGRSDFENQVNNSLGFPGIFRGALDSGAKRITTNMKIAAAHAIADCVAEPSVNKIVPGALDKNVAKNVAMAVGKAYKEEQ